MIKHPKVTAIEINPKLVGALFTERISNTLRIFCFYTNGDISQFDVPAEDNLTSLQDLFTKLDMDETCSSVIVEQVVQGRVYAEAEGKNWLYTLLSTPGNVLPPFNADICDLPWEVIWISPEAEILQFGKAGDPEHCFAIRTQISETDAARLVKSSNAFTQPISLRRKTRQRWVYLNLVVVLFVLGILIAGTVYYTFHQARPVESKAASASGTQAVKAAEGDSYFLLYNHQITGPFTLKTITDLNAAGVLKPETLCRAENATEWVKPAALPAVPAAK